MSGFDLNSMLGLLLASFQRPLQFCSCENCEIYEDMYCYDPLIHTHRNTGCFQV